MPYKGYRKPTLENSETIKNEISKKILDILQIKDENNRFNLRELDNDIEKQQAIINLLDEIKTVYRSSEMCFLIPSIKHKRLYSSIIRLILRDRGYILINKDINVKLGKYKYGHEKEWFIFLPQKIN